jgi:iron complex outermembrane receptor protein
MNITSRQFIAALAIGAASISLFPVAALAQADDTSTPADGDAQAKRDIVVTGTLLRGIAPPGSQTVAVSKQEALATGATTTAQLLANVPQVGDFNLRPVFRGVFNTQTTVNHPDLRNLGQAVLGGGGSATLLLLDGHRLPGMGVRQTIPDSDAIPPGAIERVEIVTDGGSAVYGSDAVGGVVNYITRKRFDGVEARGSYGFADDYQTAHADLTIGRQWDTGSLWATYDFNWHDEIYGRDRDYVQSRDWANNVPLDLTCSPGNAITSPSATSTSAIYALPSMTKGLGNRCDNGEYVTIYPRETRHSALVGLNQELTSNLELDIKAFYTHRRNWSDGGPLTGTATVTRTVLVNGVVTPNPIYRSTGDANGAANQTINFNYGPVLGFSQAQIGEMTTYGIANTLVWKLGDNWRVTGLFNYGYGENEVENPMTNATVMQGFVNTGAFNPYDVTLPSNATALKTIADWSNFGKGRNELINYRVVADGALFALPGGDVKLAVGGEYIVEDFRVQSGVGPASNHSTRRPFHVHRNTKAAFGELFVPIVGDGNSMPGIHSLSVSAAGRYDDYSDFGGTFNPKFALTYEPVNGVKFRGNWGKSFQAPSLADGAGAALNGITVLPIVITAKPGNPNVPGQVSVFLSGGGDLKPQKATIWSAGGDINPTFIPGLSLSGTYYHIKFKDLIAVPPVTSPILYSAYSQLVQVWTPTTPLTTAQLQAFAALAPENNSQLLPYFSHPGDVYFLADGRRANFSSVITTGLDFSARYETETGFGSLYARVAGNYVLSYKQSAVAGQPYQDLVHIYPRLRVATTLGATVGGLRGQATWQHTGGYHIPPQQSNLNQSFVKSFNVISLFFEYDFNGDGLTKDLALTLNVDNVFDQDPPLLRGGSSSGATGGYGANGFTLGRLFQFGIMKKF